ATTAPTDCQSLVRVGRTHSSASSVCIYAIGLRWPFDAIAPTLIQVLLLGIRILSAGPLSQEPTCTQGATHVPPLAFANKPLGGKALCFSSELCRWRRTE